MWDGHWTVGRHEKVSKEEMNAHENVMKGVE